MVGSDPLRLSQARLGWEILDLLLSKQLLDSISWESLETGDLRHRMRQLKIARLAYDDIVTKLSKLIDRRKDSLGAPQVIKLLRRSKASPQQLARAQTALEHLEELVKPVLKKYRDTRLAHIGAAAFKENHPAVEPAIRAAVDLVDAIEGTRNQYKDTDVDLRHEVLGEPRLDG
jgi:hypothetical protein